MSTKSYQLLRRRVESRLGVNISSARECDTLSKALHDVVDAKVSVTTIKRFWGIVECNVSPSKYTLNSLARYVGYRDFCDFEQTVSDSDDDESPVWERYRAKALEVSRFSLNSLKSRMGSGEYSATIRRQFTRKFFDDFRESGKVAAGLVAPSGWGKSTCVAHIVEEFFMTGGSPCYGDLLFYFDINGIADIRDFSSLLEEIYVSLLSESGEYDFKSVFMRHPLWRKGDVYVILDGIHNQNQMQRLINVVNNYSTEPWFHILFTVRPSDWIMACCHIPGDLARHFFGIRCDIENSAYHNLPPLDMYERFQVLVSHNVLCDKSFRMLYSDGCDDAFGIPEYLRLMVENCRNGKYSVLDFMWSAVRSRLAIYGSTLNMTGFLGLILEAVDMGRKNIIVVDSVFLRAMEKYRDIFDLLMTTGAIEIQVFDSDRMDTRPRITVGGSDLFYFFVSTYWANASDYGMERDLPRRVAAYYGNDDKTKFGILSWLVRFAFRNGAVDCINDFFPIADSEFSDPDYGRRLKDIVCLEYSQHPDLSGRVLRSDAELEYYICSYGDIDHYDTLMANAIEDFLGRDSCRGSHLRVHVLSMYLHFLNNEVENCKMVFARITEYMRDMRDPDRLCYIMEFAAQLMMDALGNGSVSPKALSYIEDYARDCFSQENLYSPMFINTGLILMDSLVLSGNYASVRSIAETIINRGAQSLSPFMYHLMRMINVSALHYLGHQGEAQSLLLDIDLSAWLESLPSGKFYFSITRLSILLGFMVEGGCRIPIRSSREVVALFRDMMLRRFGGNRRLREYSPRR